MDWLKAESTDKKILGTGLLLAPVNPDKPEPANEPNFIPDDSDQENQIEVENLSSEILDLQQDVTQLQESLETPEPSQEIQEPQSELENVNLEDVATIEEQEEPQEEQIEEVEVENDDLDFQEAWQGADTGFHLNLDEPPPELWTRIGISASDLENLNEQEDEEELDYEQGMSLQGAAYVPKTDKSEHGKNFTERLHETLRGRKQKAEQLREQQEELKDHHPYRSKSVIICSTLLIVMGFVFFALWFAQQWTPTKIYQRAEAKSQNGDYEGAMKLFQRGYKRYPNVLTFLTGLAKSAESADHVQTAVIAWEAYINSLPANEKDNKRIAQRELNRLKGEGTTPEPEPEQPEEKIKSKDESATSVQIVQKLNLPINFEDFLREGNDAYNLKMFNPAVIYFARAMELNGSDVRAYIGLAAAYRAKGMYFDAKRILDEALRKFKRNPTIEIMLQELKKLNIEGK